MIVFQLIGFWTDGEPASKRRTKRLRVAISHLRRHLGNGQVGGTEQYLGLLHAVVAQISEHSRPKQVTKPSIEGTLVQANLTRQLYQGERIA